MLTKKQRDLLIYIHEYMQNSGVPPSFEEMKEALGLKSKSGIHRLISGLEERGFIQRLPHRARALEIKRLPDGYVINKPQTEANVVAFEPRPSSDTISVPLCGKIAAGTPIEAINHDGQFVDIPAGLIAATGEHYALKIDGDSMVDAGIQDGDTVLIQRTETARNGDIIVALVDDHEATLKRFKKQDGQVALIPENKDYETRFFSADRVKVQGKLASLFRVY